MQGKDKILYIITKGNLGGAQRYVYDLATHLPKDRFEAVVACGEGEILARKLEEADIKTIRVNNLTREVKFIDEFKVCSELIKIIRKEKPKVINLNSSKIGGIGAVAGKIASLLEKDYDPKIIFTSHGWGFYEKHRPLFMRVFFYLSHWVTLILCDETITVSQKTKDDISWLPFVKNKIKVVHNGIEIFEILPKEESEKILSTNKWPKITIFSLSELHKNKGLDVAIRAIANLPKELKEQVVYSIAGSGEEKENLEKLVKELGMSESINFLGFVDNAKKLLSGVQIFLFPSRTENLPFAILEAGLTGLPIISSSVGGIPEIITDMKNGILVHPNNPREISEAIQYYLSHPEKMSEFSIKIKERIQNEFSLQKMLSETISIYS